MSDQAKNKPAYQKNDRSLQVTVWRNHSEKGPFYSVEVSRTYKDPASTPDSITYKTSHSFTGDEALRAAHLLTLAYQKVLDFQQQDFADRQNAA